MNIFDEPKVDCHIHIFDPARFPYAADVGYRPAGQEIGTAAQFRAVLDAYGVQRALVVGPNSGYGTDNRCLLDALAQGGGQLRGVAVVCNDIALEELTRLKAAGIAGVAFNATHYGCAYYADASGLLEKLAALDMFVQVQVEDDQLTLLAPMLTRSGVRIVVDHCGRPSVEAGIEQPGFRALLDLAGTGLATVKLSGYVKFSRESFPYRDTRPFVDALIEAYTLDACVWGSDWPHLRSPTRVDYGPLLRMVEELLPLATDRRRLLWDTPLRLLGFEPGAGDRQYQGQGEASAGNGDAGTESDH